MAPVLAPNARCQRGGQTIRPAPMPYDFRAHPRGLPVTPHPPGPPPRPAAAEPRGISVEPIGLSKEQLAAVVAARRRSRKLRRAATVAIVSGWTMATFAGLTFLGGLFGDWKSLLLGGALGFVAWNELAGGAMLKRFDAAGAARLARNQFVLAAILIAYAGWSLYAGLHSDALASSGGTTGDPGVDAMVRRITTTATWSVYGTLAVVGAIVPGLTAWYYLTRGRLVRAVVAETPPWVIETLRAAA